MRELEGEAVRMAGAILAHVAASRARLGVCRRELAGALALEPAAVSAVCERLERVELLEVVGRGWRGHRYRLAPGAAPGLAVHVFGGRDG
jgi:hypothetical protein